MSKPDKFVLDCSVTLAWYFKDEANVYANAIRGRLSQAEALVPAIWRLEVANALLVGERRKRSTEAQATTWVRFLERLPITIDTETSARAFGDVLNLARAQNLSAYDASYLELAMRRGIPLATLDNKLKTAAAAVGVSLYSA